MPAAPPQAKAAAFFDVDDTLVTVKTMLSFLQFHLKATGCPEQSYYDAAAGLEQLTRQGIPRDEVNRAYYRLFAGVLAVELEDCGALWFREQLRAESFFHQPVVAALAEHRAAGQATVLVSGSFFPALNPIAAYVEAEAVLGTEQVIKDGRLTGEVVRPMIGAAKGEAVVIWADGAGIDLSDCFAYGDHATDLDLLCEVGHPVAVGDDPVLLAHIHRVGGHRLPGSSAAE